MVLCVGRCGELGFHSPAVGFDFVSFRCFLFVFCSWCVWGMCQYTEEEPLDESTVEQAVASGDARAIVPSVKPAFRETMAGVASERARKKMFDFPPVATGSVRATTSASCSCVSLFASCFRFARGGVLCCHSLRFCVGVRFCPLSQEVKFDAVFMRRFWRLVRSGFPVLCCKPTLMLLASFVVMIASQYASTMLLLQSPKVLGNLIGTDWAGFRQSMILATLYAVLSAALTGVCLVPSRFLVLALPWACVCVCVCVCWGGGGGALVMVTRPNEGWWWACRAACLLPPPCCS